MKERGILFSAPMVRALLAGTKTQTRRPVKNLSRAYPGTVFMRESFPEDAPWWPYATDADDSPVCSDGNERPLVPPYGPVGGRMWVRETHAIESTSEYEGDPGIDPPEGPVHWINDGGSRYRLIPRYRATAPDTLLEISGEGAMRWTPAIHMFRKNSRITLEITDVRCERLMAISEADAIAEGIEKLPCGLWKNYTPGNRPTPGFAMALNSYVTLWESINGPDSWNTNPWVWCISFKRIPS